jgi:hypothetical protein
MHKEVIMDKEDIVAGKQYLCERFGTTTYDPPMIVKVKEASAGPSGRYVYAEVVVRGTRADGFENSFGAGTHIHLLPSELSSADITVPGAEPREVIAYNADDLAVISSYYQALSKLILPDDAVAEFSATIINVEHDYILGKIGFRDGMLVCDLTQHGEDWNDEV